MACTFTKPEPANRVVPQAATSIQGVMAIRILMAITHTTQENYPISISTIYLDSISTETESLLAAAR